MKFLFALFILFLSSCSINNTKEKDPLVNDNSTIDHEIKDPVQTNTNKPQEELDEWDVLQDSLRNSILNKLPSQALKTSILQEYYIRKMATSDNNKIKVDFGFDNHGADCGAPDCYTTNITFSIPEIHPLTFPKTVSIAKQESGCTVTDNNKYTFNYKLIEESDTAVSYYSPKNKQSLVITPKQVYYYEANQLGEVNSSMVHELFNTYNEEDTNAIYPYMCSGLRPFGYEMYMEK